MKKIFLSTVLVALMLAVIFVGGCTRRMPSGGSGNSDNGSGGGGGDFVKPDEPNDPIALSNTMFDDCKISSNDIANTTIGIVSGKLLQNTQSKPYYLVKFGQNNTYEKINFLQSGGGASKNGNSIITQDNIDATANKVYATDKYIYLSFTTNEIDIANDDFYFNQKNFISTNTTKTFVIDRATGEIYPMNELEKFSVYDGTLVKTTNDKYDYDSYFHIKIANGAMTVTDVLPNKSFNIEQVIEDKFDNIYVKYHNANPSSNGNIHYVSDYIYKGRDGFCYTMTSGIHSDSNSFTAFRKNASAMTERIPSSTNFLVAASIDNPGDESIVIKNDELFNLHNYNEFTAFGYSIRNSEDIYMHRATFPNLNHIHFLTDSIFIGISFDSKLFYYDLSSPTNIITDCNKNTLKFDNQGHVLLDGANLEANYILNQGGNIITYKNEPSGQVWYKFIVENNIPKLVPYNIAVNDRSVLFTQLLT